MRTPALIIITVLFAAAPARADARSPIDWWRGVLSAPGAAAADIRAPSPAIARLKAQRIAMSRAKKALSARAAKLPWAGGTTLGAKLTSKAQKRRFDRVIARALARSVHYASDGSVMLRATVGLEALRQAVTGAAEAHVLGAKPLSAIVVDARKLRVSAVLGRAISAGGARYAGPTVYHRGAVNTDDRLGTNVLRATATNVAKDGTLAISGRGITAAVVRRAAKSGALVAIVVGEK